VVDEEQVRGIETAAPSLTPRQRAARRRHRRRVFGVFVFLVVAGGVVAAAYFSFAGDDSSNDASRPRPDLTTTTTGPPVAGPYRVITGVNIREGPGTTFPSVGTIETGHVVFVTCVVDGQPVDGPVGPSTKWVKLIGFGPVGYLTVQYVELGSDLDVPGKIPVCPSA
jgi:Bacterial SH3 domain